MTGTPALIGSSVDELPTPALIVDLDAFERNLARVPALLSGAGMRWRPHAKAHKCVDIARRQIESGAAGICCQTVSEVEAFAAGGIPDILLTNQILDPRKVARLAAIPGGIHLGVCIDSMEGLELIGAAAKRHNWDVYLEVDVGGGRCGVTNADVAVELARTIDAMEMNFAGLQAYNGRAQHVRDEEERMRAVSDTASATAVFVAALNAAGLPPRSVSGGGTGTLEFDRLRETLTEVQCGSYVFMDADYLAVQKAACASFEPALTVLASVISASGTHVVVDAGLKAVATDSGLPVARDDPGIAYGNPSDEHGVLRSDRANALPPLGSRVHLIPGHCDPTVALHERIFAARAGFVEEVWPVSARGIW